MVSACVGFGTVVSECVGSAGTVGSGGVGERVRGEGCRWIPEHPTVLIHDPRDRLLDQSKCSKQFEDFMTI